MSSWPIVVLIFFGAALASTSASACTLQPPQWDCNELLHFTAVFSGISVSECNAAYNKSLFNSLNKVTSPGINEAKYYTLIMVDPDAPGSHPGQGWLHLIQSMPGPALTGIENLAINEITAYKKPTPPRGTGTHRYFLYLYEEPEPRAVMAEVTKRGNFNIHTFASDHNLCGPVTMNMFVTEY